MTRSYYSKAPELLHWKYSTSCVLARRHSRRAECLESKHILLTELQGRWRHHSLLRSWYATSGTLNTADCMRVAVDQYVSQVTALTENIQTSHRRSVHATVLRDAWIGKSGFGAK